MRVLYIIRRFPVVTQTFVLREVAALSQVESEEISVVSVLPARGELDGSIHDFDLSRLQVHRPPSLRAQLRAAGYWLIRKPFAFLRGAAGLLWEGRGSVRGLAFSAACIPRSAAIASLVRAERIEHLHTHFATESTGVTSLVARLTGTPYSFTPHAYDLFSYSYGLRRRIAEASFVVAISNFHRGFLRSFSGDETKHPVIHCGLDLDRFDFVPERAAGSPRHILCISTFTEKKGHRTLVAAFAEATRAGLDLRLRLVGTGPLMEEIRTLVADLGVAHLVDFLGTCSQQEVQEELARAAMLVQASVVASNGDSEGLPVAILEAMAVGLPVVATAVAGVPEVVQTGRTGILVDAGDTAQLCEAMLSVVRSPAGLAELDPCSARAHRARVRHQATPWRRWRATSGEARSPRPDEGRLDLPRVPRARCAPRQRPDRFAHGACDHSVPTSRHSPASA